MSCHMTLIIKVTLAHLASLPLVVACASIGYRKKGKNSVENVCWVKSEMLMHTNIENQVVEVVTTSRPEPGQPELYMYISLWARSVRINFHSLRDVY